MYLEKSTMSTVSKEDIQNFLNLRSSCIFVYRNPQFILQEFYEWVVTEPVVFKLEEKSEALVLCLFEFGCSKRDHK